MSPTSRCRSCGGKKVEQILDLGYSPLANALVSEDQLQEKESMYPLVLVFCTECSLLQLSENVPGEKLFSYYLYRSSYSDEFLTHCEELAHRIIEEQQLSTKSFVVDIGSNDGYLLKFYKSGGVPVLGIEPAKNLVNIAVQEGIPTRAELFSETLAKGLADEGKKADVIHALNCVPHVDNQQDFMSGVKVLLKDNGVAIVEFAYVGDTLRRNEFDQIYHEHKCYFSLTSFRNLCQKAGLAVVHVEHILTHGGSLRVFLKHSNEDVPSDAVHSLLREEEQRGFATVESYKAFAGRVGKLREDLVTFLQKLKSEGKRIAAYGASAKGCTLMHSCGIDGEMIDYVVDRSSLKQGRYTPGTRLKIEPVTKLLEDKPDYVLLLTWNFADEIFRQQREYRAQGGRFILPIPTPSIV